jgi:hypothetical protein
VPPCVKGSRSAALGNAQGSVSYTFFNSEDSKTRRRPKPECPLSLSPLRKRGEGTSPGRMVVVSRCSPPDLRARRSDLVHAAPKTSAGMKSNHLLHSGILGLCCLMDWQQSVSLFIVAAAAVGLLGSKLRRRRFRFDQAGHCGCSTVVGSSQSSIVFRARKGTRPEVLVKMR